MNLCSSHDVANLLKQFLRELPNPLLGHEYIDAFFEISGIELYTLQMMSNVKE